MKKLFLFTCMLMVCVVASAQITFNAKIGVGYATMSAPDAPSNVSVGGRFVTKIGFGIEKAFSPNVSIMPSLEFAVKGMELSYGGQSWTDDFRYVQVPVLFAYRLNLSDSWNLTIKAGPYAGYAVSATENGDSIIEGLEEFDAGVDCGAELEYHRICFGLEYERGFLTLVSDGKIYNSAIYFTVGYKF